MEFQFDIPVLLRILWSLEIGAVVVGFLPLGNVSEFVRELSRRGKLRLSPAESKPPLLTYKILDLVNFVRPPMTTLHLVLICIAASHAWLSFCRVSLRFTVPQSWFMHFYVLGTVVNTLLLALTLLFAYACTFPVAAHESQFSAVVAQLGGAGTGDATGGAGSIGHLAKHRSRAWSTLFLLVMLEIQLLRRLHECLNVFQYSPRARMHVLGYLAGLGFYPAVSMTLFSQHFYDQQYMISLRRFVVRRLGRAWLLHSGPPVFNPQISPLVYARSMKGLHWFQWVGLAVFALGWIQQYRCHMILASLRSKKAHVGIDAVVKPFSVDKRKTDKYEIPRGSWFEWVSCAHYLAEIVLYAGFVIASGGTNLNIWLSFTWVVGNLTLAASETHQWYKQKFDQYPPLRRAVFPFIY